MEASLAWLLTLVGTDYIWWFPGDGVKGDCGPFWFAPGPVPSEERIRAEGCNCVGLFNLLFRKLGREPVGTTVDWFARLDKKQKIVGETDFPFGTILLRECRDEVDQGHIAIVLDDGQLLHCYPDSGIPRRGRVSPGVALDPSWKLSDTWLSEHGGFYTHFCIFRDWLG